MEIEGAQLRMIRGDTEVVTVTCETEEGVPRPFEAGDTVILTVAWEAGEQVLQKRVSHFTDGAAVIALDHADTNDLLPGRYRYDVQMNAADGSVKTIVVPGDFVLEGDVTRE